MSESKDYSVSRDDLASKRTSLARGRSFFALERTFAAWIRTGFAISGAGVTLGTALRNTSSREISLIMGSLLIIMGIMTFIYALYEYFETYKFIKDIYYDENQPIQDFRFNAITAVILIVSLITISILGLLLIIF